MTDNEIHSLNSNETSVERRNNEIKQHLQPAYDLYDKHDVTPLPEQFSLIEDISKELSQIRKLFPTSADLMSSFYYKLIHFQSCYKLCGQVTGNSTLLSYPLHLHPRTT